MPGLTYRFREWDYSNYKCSLYTIGGRYKACLLSACGCNCSGDPFEFLRDLCPPIFDLGCELVEETETRIKEEDGHDLDPRWMECSTSSSSPPSSCGEVSETAAPSPPGERQTKKSIVLLTDADGQTMTFTSEETNNSSSSSHNNEELILVDWNYDDQDEKDPIDLSSNH